MISKVDFRTYLALPTVFPQLFGQGHGILRIASDYAIDNYLPASRAEFLVGLFDRYDSHPTKLVLSSSCVTPILPRTQLPVAMACCTRSVIIPGLIAFAIENSMCRLMVILSSWYFRSRVRFLNDILKSSARRDPASFSRLLA